MELQNEQTRGERAALILENTVFQEALKAIKDDVMSQWMDCPARDKEGKEALWQLAKTAQKFENILLGYVQTGKLASDKLKTFEEKRGIRDMIRRIA